MVRRPERRTGSDEYSKQPPEAAGRWDPVQVARKVNEVVARDCSSVAKETRLDGDFVMVDAENGDVDADELCSKDVDAVYVVEQYPVVDGGNDARS